MRLHEIAAGGGPVARSTVNRGLFLGSEETDCQLKRWWFRFQEEAAAQSVPLRVHSGYRDKEHQNRLKSEGRSKAVWGQSPHNFGLAVDIIHTTRAWDGMTRDHWAMLGALGKDLARRQKLDLVWGGDWSFYDPAHWEYKDWRIRAARKCPVGVKCIGKDGKVLCDGA